MNENLRNAIDFASSDNITDMQTSIELALQSKIADALEAKRIEVAQSFMQPTSERVSEELEEAYPRDRSDYDEGDAEDELSAFKGHMDDHPNYKKVAGYGKYKQFGVYKIRDSIAKNNPLAVPYIVSSSGKAVSHTNNRRIAHQDAKRLSLKEEFGLNMRDSFVGESLNEYEIVKTKGGYVDDEGNFVSDKAGGRNWQRSWTNRKRPSGFSSALQPGARIYHDVPFKRKDEAKAEGMKFDGDKKKWYHTDSTRSHYSKFEKLKESVELEEKLSVSDGVSAWIKDFVHSDDPRFEGKSKEERRQMALGAFYSAKKQQNEEVEQILEAKRLISTHGEGVHTAKVYKDPEYNEYQVHFFKNGKHMGEGPVSYHDDKDDAVSTAKHETTRMNSSVSESAPSAGLSAKEKSAVVKKAKSGKDIGKKGKGFEKVVAKAKKYGAKDPEAVAAAAMWKNIKR